MHFLFNLFSKRYSVYSLLLCLQMFFAFPIEVAFVVTDSYAWVLSASISSIVLNAKTSDTVNMHVFSYDLSEDNKRKLSKISSGTNHTINFYNLNVRSIEGFNSEKYNVIVYAKALIPSILDKLNKILILDADTIVTCSLRELWESEIGDNLAGVVQAQYLQYPKALKYSKHHNPKEHFNSGVMLINSAKYRKEEMLQKFIEESKRIEHVGDEDIFINIFSGKVKMLPLKWNVTQHAFVKYSEISGYSIYSYKEHILAKKKPNIIHFTDKSYLEYSHPYAFEFKHYLNKTPFKTQLDFIEKRSLPLRTSDLVLKISLIKFIALKICALYYSFLEAFGS